MNGNKGFLDESALGLDYKISGGEFPLMIRANNDGDDDKEDEDDDDNVDDDDNERLFIILR